MEELKVLSQEEVNDLYEMFEHLVGVLNKYAIKWCCSGGTLLGAVRHGGLIPWDDDIDITIEEKDVPLVFHLRRFITKVDKYQLVKVGQYMKLKYKDIFIDIFILDEKGNFPQRHWSSYSYIDDELYPTQTTLFGSIEVNIPHRVDEYLHRTMPDWDKVAMIYNHRSKEKDVLFLTDELKVPYLPTTLAHYPEELLEPTQ